MTRKSPSQIDKHISSRIRMRRLQLGMSQEELARALNITFQQVQKYEKGVNRVSAGRLLEIANLLSVSLQFFYQDCPGADESSLRSDSQTLAQMMASPDIVAIARAFSEFKGTRIQQAMRDLAVAVAEETGKETVEPQALKRRSARDK